jgi:hypothetical protein
LTRYRVHDRRRLDTSFNALGLPYQMTSYNAASGGTIVNQVQDGYNGLGQLTVEYQAGCESFTWVTFTLRRGGIETRSRPRFCRR